MISGLEKVMQRTLKNIPKASPATVANLKLDLQLENDDSKRTSSFNSNKAGGPTGGVLGLRSRSLDVAGGETVSSHYSPAPLEPEVHNGLRSLSRVIDRLEQKQRDQQEMGDSKRAGGQRPPATPAGGRTIDEKLSVLLANNKSGASSSWIDPLFQSELDLAYRMTDWERAMELLVQRVGATTKSSAPLDSTAVFTSHHGLRTSTAMSSKDLEDAEYRSMIEGFGTVARVCSEVAEAARGKGNEGEEDQEANPSDDGREAVREEDERTLPPLCVPTLCTEWLVRHPLVSSPQKRLHTNTSYGRRTLVKSPTLGGGLSLNTDRDGGSGFEDENLLSDHSSSGGFHAVYHTMSGDQYLHYCRSAHQADRMMLALTLYRTHFMPAGATTSNGPSSPGATTSMLPGWRTPSSSSSEGLLQRSIPHRATLGALMACDKAQLWESALEVMMHVECGKKQRREEKIAEYQRLSTGKKSYDDDDTVRNMETVVIWAHEAAAKKKNPHEEEERSSGNPDELKEGKCDCATPREVKHYISCGAEVGALMLSLLERNQQKTLATQLLMALQPKDRTLIAGAYSTLISEWGHHTGTRNVSKFW